MTRHNSRSIMMSASTTIKTTASTRTTVIVAVVRRPTNNTLLQFFSATRNQKIISFISIILLLLLLQPLLLVSATIECTQNDSELGDRLCEEKYRIGSYCTTNGICSNPFHKGCLRQVLPNYFNTTNSTNHDNKQRKLRTTANTRTTGNTRKQQQQLTWHAKLCRKLTAPWQNYMSVPHYEFINDNDYDKLRTCNSEDDVTLLTDDDNEDNPLFCRPSLFHYQEVRILSQNWESAMFSSWIMQIILSELIDVPTTLETSFDPSMGGSFNFYDPELRFTYSKGSYDYDALQNAKDNNGDCITYQKQRFQNNETYKPCAHIMPEAWNGQNDNILMYETQNLIEPSIGSGGVAKYSWYIPKFTAKSNPLLLSHFGINAGLDELENRRIMAETFLRPQTFQYFCNYISKDNCTTPYYDNDGRLIISGRPPLSFNNNDDDDSNSDEGDSYFVRDVYHGHFSATNENNCTKNPTMCTGHLSNVQCDWSTFAIPQAYYNNIPVKGSGPDDPGGGYAYGRMVEIYNAANYTKSNVLFYWFTPDALMREYLGTDSEMQRVLLPPATESCVESRVTEEQRCSANQNEHIGQEEGSCDAEAHSYQKLIVSNMYKQYYYEGIDIATRSPAYDTIKNIQIKDLWLEQMFREWYERDVDRWNYDPRSAVCEWVGENIDALQRFIPESYPRSIHVEQYDRPILFVAAIIAGICVLVVATTSTLTYKYRKRKVMLYAQPTFLIYVLSGLLFVCISAILFSTTPSEGTCMAREWFLVLGYSFELVPLIVKVAAINTLFQNAIKFKRVKIEAKKLHMTVGIIISLVALYLLIWTIIDPSTRQTNRELTDELNEDGGQVIEVNFSCSSESSVWLVIVYIYQFLLLMAATVLAFQSRKVRQEFNESIRLGFVVYSQFIFLVIRTIIWSFGSFLTTNIANAIASYLLSADVIVTVCVYFVPKLLDAMKPQEDFQDSTRSISYYSERDTRANQVGRPLSTVEIIRIDHARETKEWEIRARQFEAATRRGSTGSRISMESSITTDSAPIARRRASYRELDPARRRATFLEAATRRGSGCSRISMDSSITKDSAPIAKRRASYRSIDTDFTMELDPARRRASFLERSVEGSILAEEGTIEFEYDGTIEDNDDGKIGREEEEEDDDCSPHVEGLYSLKNIDNDTSD